jgi:tetratricopeptide (TPR) repeat protein
LYLYFGVSPALVLFWPYAALTGHYLWHKDAVVVFCVTGFLASVGLLCLVWRRYFSEVGLGVAVAGTLALGLAGFTPVILARAEVYEVAISCGYALTTLALLALWEACHRSERRGRWLALASLAYGLAVGARPSSLFGAVILLVPVVLAWREGRQIGVPLLAATVPITCIGLGLMLYNALRFGSPADFGISYELSSIRMSAFRHWSPHYLGFNLWLYFLGPARWGARFPFVHDIRLPPWPAGHVNPEHPFGVLTSTPLVWLAAAAPLAWRARPAEVRGILRAFLTAVALLFTACALNLGFYFAANLRYEMEFCLPLVLLAFVGILGLERALAGRRTWRWAARWGWGLLLAFSLAFNLLASAIYHAEFHSALGSLFRDRGHLKEAIVHLQKASALQPDDGGIRNKLGNALLQTGLLDDAIRQLEEAIRLEPNHADAHNNLGIAFAQQGQIDEAVRQFQEALRLKPAFAQGHNNLGIAYCAKGRVSDGIRQFQEALGLQPDYADARKNLDAALTKTRSLPPSDAVGSGNSMTGK